MAGLGLKTEEFSKAFQRLWFNTVVQVFNFGVVSSVVFGVSRALVQINVISQSLADGMVVCAALPLTINMVLVLTKSAGGDEASAIFNAAFGNMVGVFLSPILILGYLGVSDSGSVELWEVFYKLALRVVAPVTLGQLLQKFCPPVVAFTKKYKHYFKQAQQYCLIFIVYTVFCETFYAAAADDDDNAVDTTSIGDIFIMIAVQFCLLCGLMILSWYTFRCLFRDEPTLRVMGLFGSTQKTVAMGVPLINAIYQGNPLIGLYTLPLLIWHPMQLVVGTFLAPKLAKWVEQEQERLGQQGQQGQQEQQQPQAHDDDHDDDDGGDEGDNEEVAKKDSEDDEEEAGTKAASGSSDEEASPPSPTASAAAAAAAETTTTSNNNE